MFITAACGSVILNLNYVADVWTLVSVLLLFCASPTAPPIGCSGKNGFCFCYTVDFNVTLNLKR